MHCAVVVEVSLENRCVRVDVVCSLGVAPRDRLLKKSDKLLHLIGHKAQAATRKSSGVARTLNRCCCPHTGNSGHSCNLTSSLSVSVGFLIHVYCPRHLLVPLTGN